MTVALDNSAVSFLLIYNDWKNNKEKYTLASTIQGIKDHNDDTPERSRDNLPPNTRRHEINQIDRTHKYQKFRHNSENKNYLPRNIKNTDNKTDAISTANQHQTNIHLIEDNSNTTGTENATQNDSTTSQVDNTTFQDNPPWN
ncbi:hypothetical protein C6P45_001078 [Maudiozyma exigua]|uniref:Uncharacterized protein n=1 Tax=Maudiozyma exigua TaxID=34358 RepID=A0A9P6W4Q7_MAUEX|nr:hypothetical protein C6P45_001078 [Kazachstania exigua]